MGGKPPINFFVKMHKLPGRCRTCGTGNSIIPHPSQFVNRKFAQSLKKFLSRFCAFFTNRKKNQKNFEISIDNRPHLWYNVYRKGEENKLPIEREKTK